MLLVLCLAGLSSASAAQPVIDPESESLQRFVSELNALIAEGESTRAADPALLSDLRDLALSWPWRQRLLFDDFADGDITANPAWAASGGMVDASGGNGLVIRVAQAAAQAAEPQAREAGRDDLAAQLLANILRQAIDPNNEAPAEPQPAADPGTAQVATSVAIPNAFAVRVELQSTTTGSGRLELGIVEGGDAVGYRLAYNPNMRPGLELLRVSSRGTAIVDASRGPVAFEDGQTHLLELTRDGDGEMVVSLDGAEQLRVADRFFRESFDGFSAVSQGGDYVLRSVAIYGVP